MDMIFVRHGKTEGNAAGCYVGRLDCGMAEEGYRQAEEAKELLKGAFPDGFGEICVSPLKRAIQTAQVLGGQYKVDDRLREMDFGIFEGLRYGEIEQKYPETLKKWNADYRKYRIPGGESLEDVFDRVEDFIDNRKGSGERTLIVTHGGVIRCALSLVLGGREHFYRFQVDHGSISIAAFDGDYGYIRAVNLRKGLYG